MSKTLVAFFSASGTTKRTAEDLAANIRNGKLLNDHPSRSELTQWAQEEV